MKAHKRLMAAMTAIEKQNQAKVDAWRNQHPVTSGLIPLVDYVPPTGQGSYIDKQRSNLINGNPQY